MKLFIINGENNEEKIEINISESSYVHVIKCELEILKGNEDFKFYFFQLIHKNKILFVHNSIKYYKICENDEIWFGKIENYFRKHDDVIVYAFYCSGGIYAYEYLIVKKNDTISTIRSIIENISSEIINIWNGDGKQMKNDQIITEINKYEDYILFISCNNNEENGINYTFEYCCYLHNKRWVDRFLYVDKIRDDNKSESTRIHLKNFIKQVRQIISSNDTIDARLNENLFDLSSAYLNSNFFFRGDMAISIYCIFKDGYNISNNFCKSTDDTMKIFATYSFYAIHAALFDFVNSRKEIKKTKINSKNSYSFQTTKNESYKSIRCILIDALDYFMRYLNDPSNDWQYWMNLFRSYYLLGSFTERQVEERIKEYKSHNFRLRIKINGNYFEKFTTITLTKIIDAKKTLSNLHKLDMKHFYCIKPGGDHKPNDEDEFDDGFIIEIVMSMDDIEILKYLSQGGYGEVFLCTDKISGNPFVLKKQRDSQKDLYRDISILCRIGTCENIMNYLGLYNYDGNICMAMEYMSEGSIRSYLDERKRFAENDLLKICYQILLQIRDLHKEGIIHRDIKCENIVIDEDNNAKLIDFGLSKFTEYLSEDDLLRNLRTYKPGAVRYMAPEILKCEKYTNKIDIWSFGAAMIEMITGNIPYHNLKDLPAMLKIRSTCKIEFERPESISQEFIELINLCLNSDPDERPSAEQLIRMNIFRNSINKIRKNLN